LGHKASRFALLMQLPCLPKEKKRRADVVNGHEAELPSRVGVATPGDQHGAQLAHHAAALGGRQLLDGCADVAQALATSLLVGIASAALCLVLCWPLAQAAARRSGWAKLSFLAVLTSFIAPPAVIATGWFVLISRLGVTSVPPPLLVVTMNSLMALPFVYNVLAPAVANAARRASGPR
jgi:ABC-type Fe3+ transport system permease subunit